MFYKIFENKKRYEFMNIISRSPSLHYMEGSGAPDMSVKDAKGVETKVYTIREQKLSPWERFAGFIKGVCLFIFTAGFGLGLGFSSSALREKVANWYYECRTGTRQIKELKRTTLPPTARRTDSVRDRKIPTRRTSPPKDPVDTAGRVHTRAPGTGRIEKVSASGNVTRANLADHMQQVVQNYYGQPFPHRNDIIVRHAGKEVLWVNLTLEQQFEVVYDHSLPHNKPKLLKLSDFKPKYKTEAEAKVAWAKHIENRLFRGSHLDNGKPYIPAGLPNDPRQSHGADHGMRVGIFSAVYAALYNKYDADVNLTPEILLAIQLAGAFHDTGRQTEGVDIDDYRSAKFAVQNLTDWKFSKELVEEAHHAIEGKDNQKLSTKHFIAKCVQCGDSTEYGRVGPFNPKFLDIYKDFNGHKAAPKDHWNEEIVPKQLKGGATLAEFNQEINDVNKEMTKLMDATKTDAARKKLSDPSKNYYSEILKLINEKEHPKIYAMFTDLGVIEPSKASRDVPADPKPRPEPVDPKSPRAAPVNPKPPRVVPVAGSKIRKPPTPTPTNPAAPGGTQPINNPPAGGAPPVVTKTGELFPGMLTEVKFVCNLGGTTGAQKVIDAKGSNYARKTSGAKITPDHLRSEFYTNKAYKVLGAHVPEVAMYHEANNLRMKIGTVPFVTCDKPVMLSKFVPETTQNLDDYFKALGLKTGNFNTQGVIIPPQWVKDNAAVLKDVQNAAKPSFVADCLLANWDVAGLEFDNMKYDPIKKQMWRIDNGSGLEYRAQGTKKTGAEFGPIINEFKTFREASKNANTALLFATLTNGEIIQQINDILPKRDAFLATIPEHLKELMGKRFDYLTVYKKELEKQG